MSAVIAFALRNWQLVLVGLLAASTIYLKLEVSELRQEKAEGLAEARRLQIEAHAEDVARNQSLVIEHRKETAALKKEVANVHAQFAKVAANPACFGTPAALMFDQLVRGKGEAGSGKPGSAP